MSKNTVERRFLKKICASQDELIAYVQERLSARQPRSYVFSRKKATPAAVLIPLFFKQGQAHLLFTKRSNLVEHHKGQISFPGGAVDKEDGSVEETVLREAHEEIGLLREDVEILGRIDDTLTVASNFIVHPFVGFVPYPYDFTINAAEGERLIKVPLDVFHPRNSETKRYGVECDGVTYQTPAYEYDGDLIGGATARMMENFMNIIGCKLLLPERKK